MASRTLLALATAVALTLGATPGARATGPSASAPARPTVDQTIERLTSLTISCGVAMVADGDDDKMLLTRADSALYAAKAAGRNCAYCHNGDDVHPLESQDIMAAASAAAGGRRSDVCEEPTLLGQRRDWNEE